MFLGFWMRCKLGKSSISDKNCSTTQLTLGHWWITFNPFNPFLRFPHWQLYLVWYLPVLYRLKNRSFSDSDRSWHWFRWLWYRTSLLWWWPMLPCNYMTSSFKWAHGPPVPSSPLAVISIRKTTFYDFWPVPTAAQINIKNIGDRFSLIWDKPNSAISKKNTNKKCVRFWQVVFQKIPLYNVHSLGLCCYHFSKENALKCLFTTTLFQIW